MTASSCGGFFFPSNMMWRNLLGRDEDEIHEYDGLRWTAKEEENTTHRGRCDVTYVSALHVSYSMLKLTGGTY